MKIDAIAWILAACLVALGSARAEESPTQPCDSAAAAQFDFWLGEWKLSWPAEQMGGEEGQIGRGTNSISKMFGNCVVREEFHAPAAQFRGHSVSVFNSTQSRWQQTWVDNQGGYLVFTGKLDAGRMILETAPFQRGEKTVVNRMVFRDIERDSLDWDWQTSDDGGKTWKDLWNIHYERKPTGRAP